MPLRKRCRVSLRWAAIDMLPMLVLAAAVGGTQVELLRQAAVDVALAQVKAPSDAWQPEQRDCAGLVRFTYRQAYRRIAPERLSKPLFWSAAGPVDFADAEALLGFNFGRLGRDVVAEHALRSGDVVAFRQAREDGDAFHLMLVVAPQDKAHGDLHVVYHPGEKGASGRLGRLRDLATQAPLEWRPVASNPSFLGFFRFKEWTL
jgi:uncharacterized protein YfaT (DUF1175 family)